MPCGCSSSSSSDELVRTGAQQVVEHALGTDPVAERRHVEAVAVGQGLDGHLVDDGGIGVGAHALGDERELGQHLPLVHRALARRQDGRRVVGDVAQRELVEADVVVAALERARAGQDHVRVAARLVDVDVDRHHELELLEGARPAGRCWASTAPGCRPGTTKARTWPSPGVSISSAMADDGELAVGLGQAPHPALAPAQLHAPALAAACPMVLAPMAAGLAHMAPPGLSRLP